MTTSNNALRSSWDCFALNRSEMNNTKRSLWRMLDQQPDYYQESQAPEKEIPDILFVLNEWLKTVAIQSYTKRILRNGYFIIKISGNRVLSSSVSKARNYCNLIESNLVEHTIEHLALAYYHYKKKKQISVIILGELKASAVR